MFGDTSEVDRISAVFTPSIRFWRKILLRSSWIDLPLSCSSWCSDTALFSLRLSPGTALPWVGAEQLSRNTARHHCCRKTLNIVPARPATCVQGRHKAEPGSLRSVRALLGPSVRALVPLAFSRGPLQDLLLTAALEAPRAHVSSCPSLSQTRIASKKYAKQLAVFCNLPSWDLAVWR